MAVNGDDSELQAMQIILTTLGELDTQARGRVLDYVFRRLGLVAQDSAMGLGVDLGPSDLPQPSEGGAGTLPPPEARDIRSLKEAKDPKSAAEMAAVVAYYLAELAPPSERKASITTADLEKYFKQARYPLPKALRVTLASAASAGYFDVVARGQYKLNPVGYNLVAHGLPGEAPRRKSAAPRKRTAKRPAASRAKPKKRSTGKQR
jgi:hypothetical protein